MLNEAGLPIDDIGSGRLRLYRFRSDGGICGYAGIEGDGPDRLLRSVVVPRKMRGQGCGRAIVSLIEDLAASDGCKRLHLLTRDAARFFAGLGYRATDRSDAPSQIAETDQFARLCPAGADYMIKGLKLGISSAGR